MIRLVAPLLLLLPMALSAQEIVTAAQYFNTVSEKYGSISDYQASLVVQQGKDTLKGTLYYKSPNLLHIDFSDPAGEVINSDGKTLTVFLPHYSVAFTQDLSSRKAKTTTETAAGLASKEGLSLLKSSYSIGYVTGPDPVALDDKSTEQVVKLKLTWRSGSQAFRELELSVASNGLIRRIVGTTATQSTVQFDFTNVRTNLGVPDARFEYDSPPTANVIHNFLFEPEG